MTLQLEGLRIAGLDAGAVDEARVAMEDVYTIAEFVGVIGAGKNTLAARDAAFGVVTEFGRGVLTLRVVAPETVHRTTFEEHGGPYPRAIVQGKTLNVEHNF